MSASTEDCCVTSRAVMWVRHLVEVDESSSLASAVSLSRLLAARIRLQSSCANFLAVASPNPEAAPVMRTTFVMEFTSLKILHWLLQSLQTGQPPRLQQSYIADCPDRRQAGCPVSAHPVQCASKPSSLEHPFA